MNYMLYIKLCSCMKRGPLAEHGSARNRRKLPTKTYSKRFPCAFLRFCWVPGPRFPGLPFLVGGGPPFWFGGGPSPSPAKKNGNFRVLDPPSCWPSRDSPFRGFPRQVDFPCWVGVHGDIFLPAGFRAGNVSPPFPFPPEKTSFVFRGLGPTP